MTAYLKLDVYLLSDVFETFRKKALSEDQLDPVHFFSLPHMSYTSAFKMTRETIHLLDDYEMFTLFERGIRGGLTGVNKHRVKARNVMDSIVSSSIMTKTTCTALHSHNISLTQISNGLKRNNFTNLRMQTTFYHWVIMIIQVMCFI